MTSLEKVYSGAPREVPKQAPPKAVQDLRSEIEKHIKKAVKGKQALDEHALIEEFLRTYPTELAAVTFEVRRNIRKYSNEESKEWSRSDHTVLNRDQEEALFEARDWTSGSEAAVTNILAEHNQRLVRSIARQYNYLRIDPQDLVQAGNIGLLKAIKKFDRKRGIRFASFARWWIRAEIVREVENTGRTIRLPSGVDDKRREYHQVLRDLNAKFQGREFPIERVLSLLDLTPKELEELLIEIQEIHSLEDPVASNVSQNWGQTIAIEELTPEEAAEDHEIREGVGAFFLEENQLGDLSQKEKLVLQLRNGMLDTPHAFVVKKNARKINNDNVLVDLEFIKATATADDIDLKVVKETTGEVTVICTFHQPLSLTTIGLFFNVTRERVRQIEQAAMKRLSAYGGLEDLATD